MTPQPEVQPRPKTQTKGKARPRPIKPVSDRRRAEASQRAAVRAAAVERDQGCVGPARGLPGECASPSDTRPALEVHEIAPRGRAPGSHLVLALCATVCQRHHDDLTSASGEALELAYKTGLLVHAPPLPTVGKAQR